MKTMEKLKLLNIRQKNLIMQISLVNIVNMLPHMGITLKNISKQSI